MAACAYGKVKSPRWMIAVRCLSRRHRGVIAEADLAHFWGQAGHAGGAIRQALTLSALRQRQRHGPAHDGEKRRLKRKRALPLPSFAAQLRTFFFKLPQAQLQRLQRTGRRSNRVPEGSRSA